MIRVLQNVYSRKFFGGVVCLALATFVARRIDTVASYLIYPLISLQSMVVEPLRNYWHERRTRTNTIGELQERVSLLIAQNEALQMQVYELEAAESFVNDIKELVEFRDQYREGKGVIAQVLMRTITPHEHTIVINRGSRDGIKEGMIAAYRALLVGRVVTVFPAYSKIQLVTDKNSKVAAYCAQTKTKGIYEGQGDALRASLAHISHLKPVKVGDRVVSSGQGMLYPRGLVLGTIESVVSEGVEHSIVVKPVLDLENLNYCMIYERG